MVGLFKILWRCSRTNKVLGARIRHGDQQLTARLGHPDQFQQKLLGIGNMLKYLGTNHQIATIISQRYGVTV